MWKMLNMIKQKSRRLYELHDKPNHLQTLFKTDTTTTSRLYKRLNENKGGGMKNKYIDFYEFKDLDDKATNAWKVL